MQIPVLELKDRIVITDKDILEELAKPLSTPGDDGQSIKQWFSASTELCQKVNAWLLADSSERPALADDIVALLKTAEEALHGQVFLSGTAVTAADVAYAAAMAGFYKAVRDSSGEVRKSRCLN